MGFVVAVAATCFVALVTAWVIVSLGFASSGPETIASSVVDEEAAADAQSNFDAHIERVSCPRGTLHAGSHVLCTAEVWVGPSRYKSELLSVHIEREEDEISATVSPDRFVTRSARG